MPKTRQIKFSPRAITQDAELAMKSDIFRALIELITNSDDAYGDDPSGRIDIHVDFDAQPQTVIVSDQAIGLTGTRLEEVMGEVGGQTSGHAEGEKKRGLFGRGAKDIAIFGSVKFETIRRNKHSWLIINNDWNFESKKDQEATAAIRDKLSIPKNGFTAKIFCSDKKYHLPSRPDTWQKKIGSHVQLRQILQRRHLRFSYKKEGTTKTVPLLWEEPGDNIILDTDIPIKEFNTTVHLTLYEMLEESPSALSAYSRHGIEIRGGTASYENSLFDHTGPETLKLSGIVDCPIIDDLIRDWEQDPVMIENNNSLVVRRDRDGLEKTHNFTKALTTAIHKEVEKVLSKWRENTTTETPEGVKDYLREIAEDLRQFILDELEEAIEPQEPVTEANPFNVVPPIVKMSPGSKKSFTIQIHESIIDENSSIKAVISPVQSPTSKIVVQGEIGEITQHPNYANNYLSIVRVEAKPEAKIGSQENLKVTYGDHHSSATITFAETQEEEEPETLEWKNPSMSVSLGKERSITLRAPADYPADYKVRIKDSRPGEGVELLDSEVTLQHVKKGWLEGACRISGNSGGMAKNNIVAYDEQEQHVAKGTIRVITPSGINNSFEIVLDDATNPGPYRGEIKTDELKCIIYALHPGLKHAYELDPESEISKVLMKEASIHVFANYVIEQKIKKGNLEFDNIATINNERDIFIERCFALRNK